MAIHRLEVEDAAVRDEGLEALLVVAGQEVDRVAAIRSTDTTHAGLVSPRLFRYIVNRGEVVADVLTRVVSRDLIEPLLTERRQTATVRSNHHIALCGHQLEVPAVAPELRYNTLRATLAVEQRGVLLRGVEVGRQDHPDEHLLAVGGLHPALLDLAHRDVVVDRTVDLRELCHSARGGVDREELVGHRDGADLGCDHATLHGEGVDVMIAGRDHLHLTVVERYAAHLVRGLDRRAEVELLVAVPDDVRGVVVKLGRQVAHRARSHLVDKQTLLVRLVACTAHRTEGDVAVVGRPNGILVVARHGVRCLGTRLADVVRGAVGYLVDVDVRIGRYGVGLAVERLARVGELRAGVVPGDLGHVEVGCQRGIPRRVGTDDVRALAEAVVLEFGHEDVAVVALLPVVPVANHQVVVDACLRLGHILVYIGRAVVGDMHCAYIPGAITCGGDAEALDVEVEVGELLELRAVGGHLPELHLARTIREEVDLLAVGAPLRSGVLRVAVGELAHRLRGHLLDPEGGRSAVLGHVVVGLCVEELRAVGRERRLARAAHLPHHLGGQTTLGNLLRRQGVVNGKRGRSLAARHRSQSCKSHHEKDFFHFCCDLLINL